MTKEKVKEFLKSKFAIFAVIYAAVFLVASYFKYLDFAIIPVLIVAFIMLDVEQDFYFFLFSQAFYRLELITRPAILAEAIYIAILFVKFIIGVKQKKYPIYKTLGIMIGVFTLYSVVVSCFYEMAYYSLTYIFYLPIFYIIFCTRKEYNLVKISRAIVYSLIFGCAVSLFMLPISTRPTCYKIVGGAFRFRGFFSSPNTLYIIALLGLSCFMYLYFKNKVSFKEYIVVYFSMSILSLLTASKASIIILAILTLISVVLYLKQNFKKRIGYILIACLLLLMGMLIFKDFTMGVIKRFSKIDPNNVLNSLFTGRIDIWAAYIKDIFEHPCDCLFGHGLFSKYVFVPSHHQDRAQHNMYLFLMHKFGIVGIAFLGVIMWQFIKEANKSRPKFINYIPLIYFLIGGLVDNSFMYPHFYIIVAIALFDTQHKAEQAALNTKEKNVILENKNTNIS